MSICPFLLWNYFTCVKYCHSLSRPGAGTGLYYPAASVTMMTNERYFKSYSWKSNDMDRCYSLFAGWLIDGTGGPVRRDVLIQVENGIVASIRRFRGGEPGPSEDGSALNFSKCTVLPGLVDCHVHLTWSGTVDQYVRQSQLTLPFEQAGSLMAERIGKHLSRGIVALRDGGDSAGHTLRYRNEYPNGEGLPVYLKAAGKAWRAGGRYGRILGRAPLDGCTLAESIARQDKKADHVKIINSGLNSLTQFGKETAPQFAPDELDSAVRTARKRGEKTMVHANGELPVRLAIEARCNSIEHGFFMGGENLDRMADLQIFWTPTAFSMKAYSELLSPGSIETQVSARNLDHQLEQLAHARTAGVPVVVGTDCGGLGIYHGKAFVEEFRLLMQGGFSTEETVRCATLEGARLLGLEQEIGQLKPGMPATFVVLRGAPSELSDSLGSPQAVYVRGVPVQKNAEEVFTI